MREGRRACGLTRSVASPRSAPLKLIIVHYHLRPGGIRRVIELATPHIVRKFGGRIREVILATGEGAAEPWTENLQSLVGNARVSVFLEPAFGYFSDQRLAPGSIRKRIRQSLPDLLADAASENCLVWAHNLGIARNLILTRELIHACGERGLTLIAHHHDWWFDNRWRRWQEMRQCGCRTLADAAKIVFPAVTRVRHVVINQADARPLKRHFAGSSGWLPNLTEQTSPPSAARQRDAGRWLATQLDDAKAPVWILPCRLLRRKNVAEALLLARWLRPEAWLVTTGGASSDDQKIYLHRLQDAARQNQWRLRLGILHGDAPGRPGVAELLSVSEAVMLTSIQEGFGLPYLEAAAAGRPLIARRIPNISPDLDQFGFYFPHSYQDILVDSSLFDWAAEFKRQANLFQAWKAQLPRSCRRWVGEPVLLAAGTRPRPVAFSRLTLTAQLEVLTCAAEASWKLCAPLNPFLPGWRKLAARGHLETTRWPETADAWLSGESYARRFVKIAASTPRKKPAETAAEMVQESFIRMKLASENLFPLLWAKDS